MQNVIVIEAGRTERHYWLDCYRELFQVLAWRDFAVRYKQTLIGVLWALVRPALAMLVFTIIFGRIAKLPAGGNAPYAFLRAYCHGLNTMVGVIDDLRWAILRGQSELYPPGLMVSIAVTAFFLWFGIRQFRKTDRSFADLV